MQNTLNDHADSKIQQYLNGFEFIMSEALKYNEEFEDILDRKPHIEKPLKKLVKEWNNTNKYLAKKKKVLPKAKPKPENFDFLKTKLESYETVLNKLGDGINSIQELLNKASESPPPPSKTKLQRNFGITASTTLQDIKTLAAYDIKKMYSDYNTISFGLRKTQQQLSDRKWLQENLKSLKKDLDAAVELDSL